MEPASQDAVPGHSEPSLHPQSVSGTQRNVQHEPSTSATWPRGHTGSTARQVTRERSQSKPADPAHGPRWRNGRVTQVLLSVNSVPSQPQY